MTAPPVLIDVRSSMVTIAGRRWPGCSVVCPQHERDEPRDRWSHTIGAGPSIFDQLEVFIPSESGVLVEMSTFPRDGRWRIDLNVVARHCVEVVQGTIAGLEWAWLPAPLRVTSRISYVDQRVVGEPGWSGWRDCDPEWINEHLDRLFAMPVDVAAIADNPTVDLIPISLEVAA